MEWQFVARTYRRKYVWKAVETWHGTQWRVVYQMTKKDTPPSPDSGGYYRLDSLLSLKGDRIP